MVAEMSVLGAAVPAQAFQVADSWLCVFNHSFYSSEIFNERVEFALSPLWVHECRGRFTPVFLLSRVISWAVILKAILCFWCM